MSYTHTHVELVKTITSTINDQGILDVFQHQYRESLVSDSFETLLTGVIPTAVRTTALTNALQAAADEANDRYSITKESKYLRLAATLWNPIVANLVQSLNILSDASRPPDLPSKDKSKDQAPVRSPRLRGNATSRDIKRIDKEVLHYLEMNPAPYHKTKHIACSAAKCDYCIALFKSINLTKCSGHKPCVPSKWFPHVGPSLWKMLRKSHDKGLSYTAKQKDPLDDEIESPWSRSTKIASSGTDKPVLSQKPSLTVISAVANSPHVGKMAAESSPSVSLDRSDLDGSEGTSRPRKVPRQRLDLDPDHDESSTASIGSAIGTDTCSPINWADEDPAMMS